MLPLNPILKDAFEKFEQDFLASIYLRVNTSNPRLQQPSAPVGKVPLQVLKELEHQSRPNFSTINFTATFARTASSCNTLWRSAYTVPRLLSKGSKTKF